MTRLLTDHTMHERADPTIREFMARELSSTGLEQLRRDRLHELQAVIESLRRERDLAPSDTNADPYLCLKNPGLKNLVRHS